MNNSILVEALPEDLVNDIAAENIELSNEAGDNVEVLENKMTSAIGLMERILGEAFTTMRNKQPKAPVITVIGPDESADIVSKSDKDLDSCEGGFSDEEDTTKTPH